MKHNQLPKLLAFCLLAAANAAAGVLYVDANSAGPTPPYTNWVTAATNIQDAVAAAVTGDQILVTNGIYQSGGRAEGRVVVDKSVSIQSISGPQFTVISGGGAVRCVYMANGTFLAGFTLTNGLALDSGGGVGFLGAPGLESDAVVSNCVVVGNSAKSGGGAASVLVTGGSMPVGGTLNNCVIISNFATAFQPGNPSLGIGGGTDNCKLNYCKLVGNSAVYGGGGASSSTLSHCTLTGNAGTIEGGGGARWSTLNNCVLTGNVAWNGGGALGGTLNNCTVKGNMATGSNGSAGGVNNCTLNNCIVYYNTAPFWFGTDNYFVASFNYCCTSPLPTSGSGNITDAPLFVDQAGGNLRLQSNSPCINAGNNAYAVGSADLDGRPRIVDGTVEIGAYEFQPDVSGQFLGWLQQYGLPTDGSADYADSDNDLLNNWQEWMAGTVPTDASSALRMLNTTNDVSRVIVTWQSVGNRTYFLERATNLAAAPPFTLLASNIVGQAGTTSFADTNAIGHGPIFYRVGVQP
jgi:hypothetical protein